MCTPDWIRTVATKRINEQYFILSCTNNCGKCLRTRGPLLALCPGRRIQLTPVDTDWFDSTRKRCYYSIHNSYSYRKSQYLLFWSDSKLISFFILAIINKILARLQMLSKGRVAWDYWGLVFFHQSNLPRPLIDTWKFFSNSVSILPNYSISNSDWQVKTKFWARSVLEHASPWSRVVKLSHAVFLPES